MSKLKPYNLKEVAEKHDKKKAFVKKNIYVVERTIVFTIRPEYHIPLNRVSNHEDILHWVLHLKGKNWVDWDVLERFIKLVCEHNNLRYPK